jgi:membrane-bound acyltransferase YfiQ involved in biofilm formation
MESIVTVLSSNKALLIIAVFISILIVFSVLKNLVKAAVVLLAILVLYGAYLVYTGQKVPRTKNEAIEHVTKKMDVLKKDGLKKLKDGK